jgi:hypothetical protein
VRSWPSFINVEAVAWTMPFRSAGLSPFSSDGPEATMVATHRPLTPPNRRARCPPVHRPLRLGIACSPPSGVG